MERDTRQRSAGRPSSAQARRRSPGRAAFLLACLALLLWAQQLLVSHVHGSEHGPGDEDGSPVCALCLGLAAGHDQLAPPERGAAIELPAPPATAAPAGAVRHGLSNGARAPQQARAPPEHTPEA